MTNGLCRSGLAVALLGGVALISVRAYASDFSVEDDFGGTVGLIGPGMSSLSAVDVNFGPLGAGVFIAPDVAFGVPVAGDTIPDQGWAPILPSTAIGIGSY